MRDAALTSFLIFSRVAGFHRLGLVASGAFSHQNARLMPACRTTISISPTGSQYIYDYCSILRRWL
jgi:hypothetical protein